MNLACAFPGQGSQSVGMLAALAARYPVVETTYAEASEALGYDLWRVVQEGPESALNRTDTTQPAMLAAGVAVWRVWQERGAPEPAWMVGHSLGEYTALVCAGALQLGPATALVAERGRLMQEAVPQGEGAMAAILGLDDDAVGAVCAAAAQDEIVAPANFNSPGQVVVAGTSAAVARVVAEAKSAGARRAVLLPVSVPSHCELMRPAALRLAERLAAMPIATARPPVLHNVDVAAHAEADEIRRVLAEQLYRPVRWADTVRSLVDRGVEVLVECGPGKVLTGLNRRIDRGLKGLAVYDPEGLDTALQELEQT